jgi:hypothetical protein
MVPSLTKKKTNLGQEYFFLEESALIQRLEKYMLKENPLQWAAILAFASMGNRSVPISHATNHPLLLLHQREEAVSPKMVKWSRMAFP